MIITTPSKLSSKTSSRSTSHHSQATVMAKVLPPINISEVVTLLKLIHQVLTHLQMDTGTLHRLLLAERLTKDTSSSRTILTDLID